MREGRSSRYKIAFKNQNAERPKYITKKLDVLEGGWVSRTSLWCLTLKGDVFGLIITKKAPGALDPAVCVVRPKGAKYIKVQYTKVQNILRPLKIRAQTCVAKGPTSICLAEQKSGLWGKSPPQKTGITRPHPDGGNKLSF